VTLERRAIIARLRRRLAQLAFDRGGLIALATLVLYIWLAPTQFVDGDNAEFATLGSVGGIAHPSGYPLYLLWLRAMAWLPGSTPAHSAAIATAMLAALQILVLHAACRAWGARAIAATVAVAVFAAGPVVLRIHTEAEVFALNGLIAATVLWLAAANGPLRGARRAALLGVVAGLGLSNHLTCALLAPVGILALVRAVREAETPRPVVVALAAVGLVAGLTPYLYLVVQPETAISWGRIDSFDALVGHVLRRDYGGPGAFSGHGATVPALDSLTALGLTIGRAWLWLLPFIGLGTLGLRSVRAGAGEPRWGWAMLAISWLLAGPLLAARFNVPPVGLGLYVCQRFHILPALLLTIPVAVGLDQLGSRWANKVGGSFVRSLPATSLLATLAFVAIAGTSLPHIVAVHSPAVESGVRNVLRTLPPNAVVITSADELYFGAGYLQTFYDERPDVFVVDWATFPLPWYRERLVRAGLGFPLQGDRPPSVRFANRVFAAGRPLFVDRYEGNIVNAFPSHPFGILIQVLPRDATPPELDAVVEINRAVYAKFDLAYPRPGLDDEFATELHRRYAETWAILGRALLGAGNKRDAAWAFALARQLEPQP
jgi:hypothetical protein